MAGFYDAFGGNTLNPSDVAYRSVDLAANGNLVTEWPPYATIANVLAKNMGITAANVGQSITLPDARLASPGESTIFMNSSGNPVLILAADGTPVSSVEAGGRRLILLIDNTVPGGAWNVTLLGVGTGALDIAGAAGSGLLALGTTLNVAFPVKQVVASRVVTAADRDSVLVWTGGAGTLTLPAVESVGTFSFEVRNQGTGALTLLPSAGTIDSSANIILNNTESCWVHTDTGQPWYTVGRGRNAQFNFTQLLKAVTGGTVVLTLTEAANVVQTYTGTLLSNVDIVLPSVVQIYYVSNQTAGAFNFRLKNPGAGATFSLPAGQNAVVFSDGTNVINASTTIAGIGSISFGAGTAASPSVQIGAVNNGLFAPTSTSLGYSSNGTQVVNIDGGGLAVALNGNAFNAVTSVVGSAQLIAASAAGTTRGIRLRTNALPRWDVGTDTAAESGANAGSNYTLNAYNDAGTFLATYMTVSRATGAVTIPGSVRVIGDVGEVVTMIGDAVGRAGLLHLGGALVSRAAYPDLWTYAQTTTPVSEAVWNAGQYGRFSVGDGSTTFRLPDLRGLFVRGLDVGRGVDAGRAWGTGQTSQNLSHNHGVNDGGHNHGVNDPTHAHGVADGGHNHGVNDGGHAHTAFGTLVGNGGTAQTGFPWNQYNAANSAVSASGANISLNASGTGIGIYGNYTGISLNASGTGISIQANGGGESRPINVAYPMYVRY